MNLKEYSDLCHDIARDKGFWDINRSTPHTLMLVVTECSEAVEADRLGNEGQFIEEIADIFIRLFDLCGYKNIDIQPFIDRKIAINRERPRLHGKKY